MSDRNRYPVFGWWRIGESDSFYHPQLNAIAIANLRFLRAWCNQPERPHPGSHLTMQAQRQMPVGPLLAAPVPPAPPARATATPRRRRARR